MNCNILDGRKNLEIHQPSDKPCTVSQVCSEYKRCHGVRLVCAWKVLHWDITLSLTVLVASGFWGLRCLPLGNFQAHELNSHDSSLTILCLISSECSEARATQQEGRPRHRHASGHPRPPMKLLSGNRRHRSAAVIWTEVQALPSSSPLSYLPFTSSPEFEGLPVRPVQSQTD